MPFPRRWVLMGRAPERGWVQGELRWPRARHPSGGAERARWKGMPGLLRSVRSRREGLGAMRGEGGFSLGRLRTFCCKNLWILLASINFAGQD